jgi:HTH-type transcriptional regulator / antitoxin HipB
MHVRTPREVGALIRERRRTLALTQAQLAQAAGVTRAWVIAIERGKSSVELILVLRTFAVLGLVADVVPAPISTSTIDLDEVLHG